MDEATAIDTGNMLMGILLIKSPNVKNYGYLKKLLINIITQGKYLPH